MCRSHILNIGTRLASHLDLFMLTEKPHATHWIGGLLGPKGCSGYCGQEKYSCPAGKRILIVQPIASHFTD
jgi:hypothetical protein